jgi:uncharacterized membrane protein YphA (DoxX/SURF4 family)
MPPESGIPRLHFPRPVSATFRLNPTLIPMSAFSLSQLTLLARTLLAGSVATIGLIHAVAGEAVTRLFPVWPASLIGRPFWAHAAGALVFVFGLMLVFGKQRRLAAAAIASIMILAVLSLHLPRSLRSDGFGDEWLNLFKWLAMAGGVLLLRDGPLLRQDSRSSLNGSDRVNLWIRGSLAAFLIGAAVLHVRFASPIAQYFIPAWIPWRLFWTYFTAAALAAGGIGLLVPLTRRLAGRLTSLMIFLWCPLIHVPRVIAEPKNAGEWSGVFESLGFAAIAWLLAEMRREPSAVTGTQTTAVSTEGMVSSQ